MIRLLLLLILSPALLHGSPQWFAQVTGGGLDTNEWFRHDVGEDTDGRSLCIGVGRTWKENVELFFTLDYLDLQLQGEGNYHSLGITPRIRYSWKRFTIEGGLGFMRHNLPVEGFTYRYKWSPQFRLGLWLVQHSDIDLMATYTLAHYSHSFLTGERNLGLNSNGVELTAVYRFNGNRSRTSP